MWPVTAVRSGVGHRQAERRERRERRRAGRLDGSPPVASPRRSSAISSEPPQVAPPSVAQMSWHRTAGRSARPRSRPTGGARCRSMSRRPRRCEPCGRGRRPRSSPGGSPTSSADCSPGPTWRPASCRGPSHHAVTADEARCAGRDPVRLGRPVGHHDAPRRPVHDGELRARERRGILPPVRSPSARSTARPSGQPVRNAETNGPQMTRARTSPKQEPGSEPHFLWRARRDSNPQPSDP